MYEMLLVADEAMMAMLGYEAMSYECMTVYVKGLLCNNKS